MFYENGKETLIQWKSPEGEEHLISVDEESQARMLNAGWLVLEEICETSREPGVWESTDDNHE
jgi:hypothetical protein